MTANKKSMLRWITEIQAIAQNGLTYTSNDFDKERFHRLRDIAAELTTYHTDNTIEEIKELFSLEKGYATPKVDVRSFALKNDKLLLVKERTDGLWTLPGGWIDVNETPSEAVARETVEESGFEVKVIRLLALWDKQRHDHPPQWPHIYKCFFHCEIIAGEARENLEIAEIDFFEITNLPPLSTPRVTQSQILRLYQSIKNSEQTLFD